MRCFGPFNYAFRFGLVLCGKFNRETRLKFEANWAHHRSHLTQPNVMIHQLVRHLLLGLGLPYRSEVYVRLWCPSVGCVSQLIAYSDKA